MVFQKISSFRYDTGISQPLTRRILEQGLNYGLTDILPFRVEQIQIAEWVGLKCRYGCNRYGTSWCCPPATPSPEKVRAILAEYDLALLVTGVTRCADFYRENTRKRAVQVRCWKGTVSLERKLFLEGYYKAFSLVGGCCALCKECAYPDSCRFPQEKRPSVESFSIDVIHTLRNLGKNTTIASQPDDHFNYYGIILLE